MTLHSDLGRPLSTYLFNIKREDARRALEALYLEESTDPRLVLDELRTLHFDLEEYIRSVEDEIARGNGHRETHPHTSKKSIRAAGPSSPVPAEPR